MLLPGIVGEFMFIIPLVVTIGLLVSLIEAFWILPAHVVGVAQSSATVAEKRGHWRAQWTHKVRVRYTRALAYVFRRPVRFFIAGALAFVVAVIGVATEQIRVEFFTFDPIRMFYVNVEMPPSSPIEATLAHTKRVRNRIAPLIDADELRAITSMAGIKFTDTEALFGDQYGQIQVSLNPKTAARRSVKEVVEAVREAATGTPGDADISFFELTGGPPVARDIAVQVRADNYEALRAATDAVKEIVQSIDGSSNVEDNDVPGRFELTLELDDRAIRQAGLSPGAISRLMRLHVEGEIVAFMRDDGEKVELRVRGPRRVLQDIGDILDDAIALPQGGTTTFRALTTAKVGRSSGTIRHYNYRRSITIVADLDPLLINAVAAKHLIDKEWARIQAKHSDADLDFSGAFDDIQESLDAMLLLFLFGIGLIYLILATQFRSYFQPMLIITTLPMAFTGVVLGLYVTGNPLSLYTLYGIIALTGIAVNSAIVLIDAANSRIDAGMRPLHAIMYAARRRVIPIIMTAMTTIAGLFSLAAGLGGKSLLWGPVATSMVFGLFVATILTLFLLPVLFRSFMRLRDHRVRKFVVESVLRLPRD
jgi:multidrug efflux pump subunit AcrB